MGRLKEFSYKNMWLTWIHRNLSTTMVANGCKLQNFCLIVSAAAHLWIIVNMTNRRGPYATPTGLLKAPRLRAAATIQEVWLETFYLHFLEFLWGVSR